MRLLKNLTIFFALFSACATEPRSVGKPDVRLWLLDSSGMATDGTDVLSTTHMHNFVCTSSEDMSKIFTYIKGGCGK